MKHQEYERVAANSLLTVMTVLSVSERGLSSTENCARGSEQNTIMYVH